MSSPLTETQKVAFINAAILKNFKSHQTLRENSGYLRRIRGDAHFSDTAQAVIKNTFENLTIFINSSQVLPKWIRTTSWESFDTRIKDYAEYQIFVKTLLAKYDETEEGFLLVN